LKNKNSKFKEKGTAKVAKPLEDMSAVDVALFTMVSMYLVESRLNAVISKEKELTQKDFGRIMGLFMQDAINDFTEDAIKDEEDLDLNDDEEFNLKKMAEDYKRLNRELQKVAQLVVRQYWIENF
jgi:hypothetical protein